MKGISLIVILLFGILTYGQERIFKANEVFKYVVTYETENLKSYDTISIFVTGNMWKQAPNSQKEIIIRYDLEKIDRHLFNDLQTIGWVHTDTTGAVENENTCWFHPPRHNQFMMLELAPFPRIDYPLEVGKEYSGVLFIGEGWGEFSNSKVYWNYEVKMRNDNCWYISAEAMPTAFPADVNRLDLTFDENAGFTRLKYSFSNGTNIEMIQLK